MGSGQKFVPNGVMLRCSSGTAPGTLKVIPKPVKLSGQIFATEMDTIPFLNIPMFGGCRNKPYCAPCTPIPSGWQNVCSDGVKVFGARPLLANSSNSCGLGGRITISNVMSAGGGGSFSSMFASVTPKGLPDVSALSGTGSNVPIQANPRSAVANVGGVATLAGSSGFPPVKALTNLPTNISNLPSVSNVAAAVQNSGLTNAMSRVAAGMEQVKDKFDNFMGKAQGFVDKGQQFLGKATDFAGKLNQYGGMATRLLGNNRLQAALQKWTNKLQNVQNQVNKGIQQFNTYKDAAQKGLTYLNQATRFLSDFSKQLGNGALAAKWNAFKSQLGQRAKSFFNQIKQSVHSLKNQKYPDTIGGWLKGIQSGFSDLSNASNGLSKGLKEVKSHINGASEGIKSFGGVVSTLTGNPCAKEAMEKWAAEFDKVSNQVGDAASKTEKAADILKKGAEYAQKGAAFLEKDTKIGSLKDKWDKWSQNLGGTAGSFFESMKTNIQDFKNRKTPDSVSGWLEMGGTGLSDLSGLFGKTNDGIKNFKNIISNSAGQIRSIGGIVSRVTGNKALEKWADKWDNAANQVNQVATTVADYQDKLKKGGEILQDGSKLAQKADDFIKKFKNQLPAGSPFQNWGARISNWVTGLKKQSFELPKMGSVKELLGDLEKLSGNLGVGLDKVSDILGKGDKALTNFAGIVGLFDKNTAAKFKKWAAKVAEFREKAKKAAETARKIKEQLNKLPQKIADLKEKWKKAVEKAKAFWEKMKAKFPKFNKGLDLSRHTLPMVPPVAKLAVPTVQSVQGAQVAALSPVPILPVAPPSAVVANSAAAPTSGAVKGGSVKVSVSVSGSGVVNGTSRTGNVNVTKPNIQLPDMSDKNAPKVKTASKPPVKPKIPVKPVVKPPVKPKIPVKPVVKPPVKPLTKPHSPANPKASNKIVDKMRNDAEVMKALKLASEKTGIPVDDLMVFAYIESSGNKNVGTNKYGYTGLMQMGKDAVADVLANFPEARAQGISWESVKNNVEMNALAAAYYMKLNNKRTGAQTSDGALYAYLAHQQGAAGLKKLLRDLKNNPNQKLNNNQLKNLPAEYIHSKGGADDITIQDFFDYWESRFNNIAVAVSQTELSPVSSNKNEGQQQRREAEEVALKKAIQDKKKSDEERKKQISEGTHNILSALGYIPALGIIPDIADTGLYLIEGNWKEAGMSAIGIIPIFGDGAKLILKDGKKVIQLSETALRRIDAAELATKLKTVKTNQARNVIEISQEMKTIEIGKLDWRKSLNLNSNQIGIVYILKDSVTGEILKIGKTTIQSIEGRFGKYLTYANKSGKKLSADIFTIDKNNSRTIEKVEAEIRNAWGADKALPWDNSKRRLGRKGSGMPVLQTNNKPIQRKVMQNNGLPSKSEKRNAKKEAKNKQNGNPPSHKNRSQAFKDAKQLAGLERNQKPVRRWTIGDDKTKRGNPDYVYSDNKTHHGNYREYRDSKGDKKLIVEHTNDGNKHFHAGQVPEKAVGKAKYDFKDSKNGRYDEIKFESSGKPEHHIYYE